MNKSGLKKWWSSQLNSIGENNLTSSTTHEKEFPWADFMLVNKKITTSGLESHEKTLLDLLNSRAKNVSLKTRGELLSHWMLTLSTSTIDEQTNDKPNIKDSTRFAAYLELLIFYQQVIKRHVYSSHSKEQAEYFMQTLHTTIYADLGLILGELSLDTDSMLKSFSQNLKKIDRKYDSFDEGTKLVKEAKVRILTCLYGDYNSEGANEVKMMYQMNLSFGLKSLEIDRFVS